MHQRIFNTGHRRIGGFLAKVGQSTNMAVYVEGEYAFTDRLSVSAGLPYVFAKYTARNLPPPPIPVLSWDACHCWQSGFQDFAFGALQRFQRRLRPHALRIVRYAKPQL